jgi:hypothetical protein
MSRFTRLSLGRSKSRRKYRESGPERQIPRKSTVEGRPLTVYGARDDRTSTPERWRDKIAIHGF